jgi:hypothetical protein
MSMYVYVSTWCHLLKTSCLTKRWVLGGGASKYIYISQLFTKGLFANIAGHLGLWPRNCWGSTVFPNRPIRGGLCHQIAWHNHCNHRNSNHSDHRNQSQQSHHHHHPFLTHYLPILTHFYPLQPINAYYCNLSKWSNISFLRLGDWLRLKGPRLCFAGLEMVSENGGSRYSRRTYSMKLQCWWERYMEK